MKKILKLLVVIFILSLFSCGMKEPVREWFEYYTETAQIIRMDYDLKDLPTDNEGFICLPSFNDRVLTFTMRNPQRYMLDFDVEHADSSTESLSSSKTPSETFTQTTIDPTIVTLTYDADYLTALEMGGDLSGFISIVEPKSQRTFTPYGINLRVNSPPPSVKNLIVLQTDTAPYEYVLAFNKPKNAGIHKDLDKINIIKDNTLIRSFDFDTAITSSSNASNCILLGESDPNIQIAGKDIYFNTGIPCSTTNSEFTIRVYDEKGLYSDATVNASSVQLNPPSINTNGATIIEANDDGIANVVLTAASNISNTTVCCEVTGSKGTQTYTYKNSLALKLPIGKWEIKYWSHKPGYLDSEELKVEELTVTGVFFIDENNSNPSPDGTRANPYKTIADAKSVADSISSPLVVVLLSDINLTSTFAVSSKIKINGQGHKINAPAVGDAFSVNSGELDLINVHTDKVTVSSSAIFRMEGSSTAQLVYLKDGATIKIAKKSGSGITKVECETPVKDLKVLESADSSSLTQNVINLFESQNDGYYIDLKDDVGKLQLYGISIKVNTIKGAYTVTVNGLDGKKLTGTELRVTSIKADGETENIEKFDTVKTRITLDGTVIQSSNTNSITIDDSKYLYKGEHNYIFEVIFEDLKTELSASILFTKPAATP